MQVKEEHIKWNSPTLGKEFEMLVYGHYGTPVIIFPTTMGRHFESKDFKLIDSAANLLNEGRFKIYCPDSIDKYSWYNKKIHPAERVKNHMWYDKFIAEEVVGAIRESYGINKVVVAGASFGGFHAANFAFKHPEMVSHLISMSGAFDIRSFVDGYYDDNVYFNNPIDYIKGDQNPELWKLKVILGYGEWDICKDANLKLGGLLQEKNMNVWMDERRWAEHDWPLWRTMFPDYLSKI